MSRKVTNIYVCGPTVYDDAHIGNLRPVIVFDIFIKNLIFQKKEFKYVHNITDIDDKIIERSMELGITEQELSKKYYLDYLDLFNSLNITMPTHLPLVTENIDHIKEFINKVFKKGYANEQSDGVYFQIKDLPSYGSLANRNVESSEKNNFALWKKTTKGISFDSNWGKGRPGWHTECSALIDKYFNGETIDLHGGGIDLLFPHHENEQIQYLVTNGVSITKKWLHVGKLLLDDKKMSKSLGNFFYAKDFIKEYDIDLIRAVYFLASPTKPLNLDEQILKTATNFVSKYKKAYIRAVFSIKVNTLNLDHNSLDSEFLSSIEKFDFSKAFFLLTKILRDFNKSQNKINSSRLINSLKVIGFVFTDYIVENADLKIYEEWNLARKANNYSKADRLKKILKERDLI